MRESQDVAEICISWMARKSNIFVARNENKHLTSHMHQEEVERMNGDPFLNEHGM